MKVIRTIHEVRAEIADAKMRGLSVGLVPTMGYLHEGHLSLIKEARVRHDVVVMSLFVNPLQFGPNEDFEHYPRNGKRDERLAREAGVDIIFNPSVEEMYPTEPAMKIRVEKGVDVLCGKSRPGHFDGVATVVMKLFQIVQPDEAFFGEKDAQQAVVLMNMVSTFNVPVKIVTCPTVREEDGLAKSSRNVNLSKTERHEAPMLYKALLHGEKLIRQGETDPLVVIDNIKQFVQDGSGTIDYVEILQYPSLERMETVTGKVILVISYHYERARLIDNIIITV